MNTGADRLRNFRNALAGLSRAEQKLVFEGISPQFKSALWQDRLTEAIGGLSGKDEKELLKEIASRLSPEAYAQDRETETLKAFLKKSESSAQKAFGDFKVYARITTTLGDDACETQVFPGPPLATCNCASEFSGEINGNDCGALNRCQPGGCTPTNRGCGTLWLWDCDGHCL